MPQYPFNNSSDVTTIVDLIHKGNVYTSSDQLGAGQYLGAAIVFVIWIIIFASLTNREKFEGDILEPVFVSSFATFVFAIILDQIGIIPKMAILLPFIFWAGGIFAHKLMEKD